jgi:hypothetical protein
VNGQVPKSDRLAKILQVIREAPAASTHDEALRLLAEAINAVEDELSGVPYDPMRSHVDGRLYPPVGEYESESDIDGARCYRQRGHLTYVGPNGSICICRKSGELILSKPGTDGVYL